MGFLPDRSKQCVSLLCNQVHDGTLLVAFLTCLPNPHGTTGVQKDTEIARFPYADGALSNLEHVLWGRPDQASNQGSTFIFDVRTY